MTTNFWERRPKPPKIEYMEETPKEVKAVEFKEVHVNGKVCYVDWYNKLLSMNEDGSEPVNFEQLSKRTVNQIYWEFRRYDKTILLHPFQSEYFKP